MKCLFKMNNDFEINRSHIYSLEWIRSEMELKVHEFKIKNKDVNVDDANKKIESLSKTQSYLFSLYEEMESRKKTIEQMSFLNKKLLAELSMAISK